MDRGIAPSEIRLGILATVGFGGWQLGNVSSCLAEELGAPGLPTVRLENACASGGTALFEAARAVHSGLADVVLAAGVEKMTDCPSPRRRYWLGVSGDTEWERPAGLTFAGVYALMASRYEALYGPVEEALCAVALKNHANGAHNPLAHFQRPISRDQYYASPPVADPLRLYDCCPVSDGAAAVLVARDDLARRYTDTPVRIEASALATDTLALQDRRSLTSLESTRRAVKGALQSWGRELTSLQMFEVHDCFTIAELLALEDLGLVARGEAGKLTQEGETARDGRRPVNPSGGLKAKGHPLGATGLAQAHEVFEQLRGRCGPRQVPGVETALAHNVGGSGGTCTVHIFSV